MMAGPAGPVRPVLPRGIVKSNTALEVVPTLVTVAFDPAAPVVVVPAVTVAEVPFVPLVPLVPEFPRGMVKLSTAATEVPEFATMAPEPAAPVVTVPTATVAADPGLPGLPGLPGVPVAGLKNTTPNSNSFDIVSVTAQAGPLSIAAPSGLPTDGQQLIIRLRDNGTTRALTWNAVYSRYSSDLPTTTVVSSTMTYIFLWNSSTNAWDLVGGNPIPGKWG